MRSLYDSEKAEETPLYCRYSGECQLQRAYIEIHVPDRTINADVDGEIGGAVSCDVWNKVSYRFTVSPYMDAYQVEELIEELIPHAKALCDECEIEWDGRNYVGSITERGRRIHDKIDHLCENTLSQAYDCAMAAEWISYDCSLYTLIEELLGENDNDVDKCMEVVKSSAESEGFRLVELADLRRLIESERELIKGRDHEK